VRSHGLDHLLAVIADCGDELVEVGHDNLVVNHVDGVLGTRHHEVVVEAAHALVVDEEVHPRRVVAQQRQ